METLAARAQQVWLNVSAWLSSPAFYIQLIAIAAALALAFGLALVIRARVSELSTEPAPGPWLAFRRLLFELRNLVFPLLAVLLLGVAADVALTFVEQAWLVRIAQSFAVVFLLYTVITRFIADWLITQLLKWIGIPLATLHVFGWLDDVAAYLDGFGIRVGNIQLSVYDIGRTVFFGIILFWLGRISNTTGKRAIRNAPNLDIGTREVAVKLFEIALFVVLAFVLLNIMGINLTALTVFGGAFGIGLGLGLQRIAANFISGIIILLDRSITIGDYIELKDGYAGRLRELNMRFATLETFDGKDIVVPNETFVSDAFINWTHADRKQRYSIEFAVAYGTDIPALLTLVKEVCVRHPQVLTPPDVPEFDAPDAEIQSFGDSGINIEVEFWMDGIDDGPNSVRADLMLMIWTVCKEHGIEMPFPQREVRILNPGQS